MSILLGLQYAAYQSEALIHGDFTIQPLMQTLAEIIEEHSKCVFLKAVLNDKIIDSVRAHEETVRYISGS